MAYFTVLIAQDNLTTLDPELNVNSVQEKLVVLTDRSLYSVDETINFKINYFKNPGLESIDWSSVVYVELIKPDGISLVQSNLALSTNNISGSIHIPKQINTGIYYLKAYTKWMRNYPTSSYAYVKLKLINPYHPVIEKSGSDKISADTIVNSGNINKMAIDISLDKLSYTTREKVTVCIEEGKEKYDEYILSAVKKGSKANPTEHVASTSAIQSKQEKVLFYPEIEGMVISGNVINTHTQKAEANVLVNLSLINDISYYAGFQTDSDGSFYFCFPEFAGVKDFFISAEKDSIPLTISVDQEYCTKAVNLKSERFNLTESERILAEQISINAQLSNKYSKYLNQPDSLLTALESRSFYGKAKKTLYTKDFIDLPVIEEFIFELIPEISISYTKGKPFIRTSKHNVFYNYPFLIMADNIPVTDLVSFLAIKTNTIEYIELIDNSYVIGNLKYNGIINAFTKNKGIAGLELPQNSMFFSYQMYSQQHVELNNSEVLDRNIPDRRNCMYWNPEFQIPEGATKGQFSFHMSDEKGEYEIIVQGISQKGSKVNVARKSFVVK